MGEVAIHGIFIVMEWAFRRLGSGVVIGGAFGKNVQDRLRSGCAVVGIRFILR